jgi:tryptophan synthase beta subunit
VYTGIVAGLKNITLSAAPESIERARLRARLDHTTLNEAFRQWLDHYAGRRPSVSEYDRLMKRLGYVDAGRKFSREEMNQRAAHK